MIVRSGTGEGERSVKETAGCTGGGAERAHALGGESAHVPEMTHEEIHVATK